MFRTNQKLSFVQILLLVISLIGSLLLTIFLLNFFFWFIVLALGLSFIYRKTRHLWSSRANNAANESDEYLVVEYERIERD